jgi:hypothetical protein
LYLKIYHLSLPFGSFTVTQPTRLTSYEGVVAAGSDKRRYNSNIACFCVYKNDTVTQTTPAATYQVYEAALK